MIDITGIDLVEFAKKVYELSVPQGLGILHYSAEPITDEEAKQFIQEDSYIALNMDYVKGRACKMVVWRKDGKLTIADSWYDHTDRIYQELLEHFNIQQPEETEHGPACNCIDCQNKRAME